MDIPVIHPRLMGVVVAQVQVIAATPVHIAALVASQPTPPVGALIDPRSPAQAMSTILYRIVGAFTHRALWDFTSLTSLPAGLIASDHTANDMAGNPVPSSTMSSSQPTWLSAGAIFS